MLFSSDIKMAYVKVFLDLKRSTEIAGDTKLLRWDYRRIIILYQKAEIWRL